MPIFGREEDAADQFAAYALLQLSHEETQRIIIGGIAHVYAGEAEHQHLKLKHYADVHSLPAQRYFNLLCMAYGADPKLFAYVVDKSLLPKERAETCDEEYQQIAISSKRVSLVSTPTGITAASTRPAGITAEHITSARIRHFTAAPSGAGSTIRWSEHSTDPRRVGACCGGD